MVDQSALLGGPSIVQGLLKSIRCPAGDLPCKSAERGEQSQFWLTAIPAICYPKGICVQITQGDDAISECVDDEG